MTDNQERLNRNTSSREVASVHRTIAVTARGQGLFARLRLTYPDTELDRPYDAALARELLASTCDLPAGKRALIAMLIEYRHALADLTTSPGQSRPRQTARVRQVVYLRRTGFLIRRRLLRPVGQV